MTDYTEQSPDSITYGVLGTNQTIWDNGGTLWDVNGNIAITVWDDTPTSFVTQNPSTPAWIEV